MFPSVNAIPGPLMEKTIGGTASNAHNAYRNFVSPVSIFSASGGIVLHCGKIENKKESEIPGAQELIKALDIIGEIFTLDALYCQKNDRSYYNHHYYSG